MTTEKTTSTPEKTKRKPSKLTDGLRSMWTTLESAGLKCTKRTVVDVFGPGTTSEALDVRTADDVGRPPLTIAFKVSTDPEVSDEIAVLVRKAQLHGDAQDLDLGEIKPKTFTRASAATSFVLLAIHETVAEHKRVREWRAKADAFAEELAKLPPAPIVMGVSSCARGIQVVIPVPIVVSAAQARAIIEVLNSAPAALATE
jgi:hypothetical protein